MNGRLLSRSGLMLLVVAATMALAGCASGDDVTDGATDEFVLTGVEWQWQSMTVQGGDATTVANPAAYTVNFNDDGTLFGTADCNNYAGSYTTENGGIQITLGPTTAAFCGEESLDLLFLESLGQVVAGGPDGTGGLALTNAGGERYMRFADGGPSPSQ